MKNFKPVDCDYDYSIYQRVIEGKITKKRYKTILGFIRKKNNSFKYPYGISPNGYAYSCGCSHDCCGCLSREGLKAIFSANKVIITHSQSFNY